MSPGPPPGRDPHDLRRAYAFALLGAVVVIALVILFGPTREKVREHWDVAGREGPLQIMPQLSIDEGGDDRRQERQRRPRLATPPAPTYEVEPDEHGERPAAPVASPAPARERAPQDEPGADDADAVELQLPAQTSPCFHLVRQIQPRYPADASIADRERSLVQVKVAFFVGPSGSVDGSYVMESDGGPEFGTAALAAVDRWLYDPDFAECSEPEGFWNVLTVTFHGTAANTRSAGAPPAEPRRGPAD